jgi:hypothetical protein
MGNNAVSEVVTLGLAAIGALLLVGKLAGLKEKVGVLLIFSSFVIRTGLVCYTAWGWLGVTPVIVSLAVGLPICYRISRKTTSAET